MSKEIDHSNVDYITCPNCGRQDHDSTESLSLHGEQGAKEECDKCGCEFKWTADISVTYTTEKIP